MKYDIYFFKSSQNEDGEDKEYILVPQKPTKEFLEKVTVELKKRFENKLHFMGTYPFEMSNGAACIPWNVSEMGIDYTWVEVSSDRILFLPEQCLPSAEECEAHRYGLCEILPNGNWVIPGSLDALLKGEHFIWLGNDSYFELISDSQYRQLCENIDLKDLLV